MSCSIYLFCSNVSAASIEFEEIVAGGQAGIQYESQPGINNDAPIFAPIRQGGTFFNDVHVPLFPTKTTGSPSVSAFDYDRDGDVDLYVTNANQIQANSLFENQFKQTGQTVFVDKGVQAGVGLFADSGHLESTGTCFGDIDNDGDDDLYVTGIGQNVMFENMGDGTFSNITASSSTDGGGLNASSCSFGDVNNDGLLDLVVGNTFDSWVHRLPIVSFAFDFLIEPNQLFVNMGDNEFVERGSDAGIQNFNGITWATALVDIDKDGDMDLIVGDDQGPKPGLEDGGENQGLIRTYLNDGNGQFIDHTGLSGLESQEGAWMGLAIGDLNGDGHLDVFGSDVGDHAGVLSGQFGGFSGILRSSRWFLGNGDGTYTYPGIGALGTTPFGWGSIITDYDNDGDNDIIFHGGIDFGSFVDSTNPGAILNNDGLGNMNRDSAALANSVNHSRRNVHSLVNADLNNDGFVDLVSISNMDWPEPYPLITYGSVGVVIPSQFGDEAFAWPLYSALTNDFDDGFIWNGLDPKNGSIAIEMSSGNDNNSIRVSARGSVGDLRKGGVNRSGIGAILTVTPKGGKQSTRPVISGATHNSASELALDFGLGEARRATVDALWPNGVRNRIYNVRAGERLEFPEVPCSYDDSSISDRRYVRCVWRSLSKLKNKGIIDRRAYVRMFYSALRARFHN